MKAPTVETCTRMMDRWFIYGKDKTHELPKYHAQIRNQPGLWSSSNSMEEAVESLKRAHPEHFPEGRIRQIVYLGLISR